MKISWRKFLKMKISVIGALLLLWLLLPQELRDSLTETVTPSQAGRIEAAVVFHRIPVYTIRVTSASGAADYFNMYIVAGDREEMEAGEINCGIMHLGYFTEDFVYDERVEYCEVTFF